METYGSDVNIFGYHCITPHLHLSEEVRFEEREIHDNETLKSIFVDELLFVRMEMVLLGINFTDVLSLRNMDFVLVTSEFSKMKGSTYALSIAEQCLYIL